MYTIKLIGNIKIHIDADELSKLQNEIKNNIIFFRCGAINPKYIISVEPDENEMDTILLRPDETEADRQKKIEEYKSEDIFKSIRGPSTIEKKEQKQLN